MHKTVCRLRDALLIGLLLGGVVLMYFYVVAGYRPNVLEGHSMEPTMTDKSLVIVKPADSAQVGDIVKIRYNGIPTIHRVIEVTEGGYRTKGDNPELFPEADIVQAENLIGIKVYALPAFGSFWPFLMTHGIKLVVVVIVVVLVGMIAKNPFSRGSRSRKKPTDPLSSMTRESP